MPSILKKLFRKKEDVEKDKDVERLQGTLKCLQQKLLLWKDREAADDELIRALRRRINELSVQIEDAKEVLFKEMDFQKMLFAAECTKINKLQIQLRATKNKSKQLSKLLQDYEVQCEAIKRQTELMNSYAVENDRISDSLLCRIEEANAEVRHWSERIAQQGNAPQIVQQRNAPQPSSSVAFNVL